MMYEEYLALQGIVVATSSLQVPRAIKVASALASGRFVYSRLVECRVSGVAEELIETIVIDLEIERPQRPRHDIRRMERIAVRFRKDDSWYPEVLSLRPDFPRVSHLNLRADEFPRSLCLYDQPWSEVMLRWTAIGFIELIRSWLAKTADAELHADDQPLEPFVMGIGFQLVIAKSVLDPVHAPHPLKVHLIESVESSPVFIVTKADDSNPRRNKKASHFAVCYTLPLQVHGIVRKTPQTFSDLAALCEECGFPLLTKLREHLWLWKEADSANLGKKLILILTVPLQRETGQPEEASSVWAFVTTQTVSELGISLGAWVKLNNGYGKSLSLDESKQGQDSTVVTLNTHFELTRKTAARTSGYEPNDHKIVGVGVGALGSQVVNILARSGFGIWTLVDEDAMLPHNLVRHTLSVWSIGFAKADCISTDLHGLFDNEHCSESIVADVLAPGKDRERLSRVFSDANIILDMSASVPVARHLANDVTSEARRISLFLNPKGTDLVLLGESENRTHRLDVLEMQYYRAIIENASLANHLGSASGTTRYARSCRDVSRTIPNDSVVTLAGIGAKAIRQTIGSSAPSIRIWQSSPSTGAVSQIDLAVTEQWNDADLFSGWSLFIDKHVTETMAKLREEKLPRETGGVLVGGIDHMRRIIYVVCTIPSPPDSKEWPTLYIRGSRGLQKELHRIGELTSHQLEYLGEWHSHPNGASCLPSDDDLRVFGWLTEHMADGGMPALMAIAGERNNSSWFLGVMSTNDGWEIQQ